MPDELEPPVSFAGKNASILRIRHVQAGLHRLRPCSMRWEEDFVNFFTGPPALWQIAHAVALAGSPHAHVPSSFQRVCHFVQCRTNSIAGTQFQPTALAFVPRIWVMATVARPLQFLLAHGDIGSVTNLSTLA